VKHFLLIYEADADYAEKRAPHRAAHLALAKAAAVRGELLAAGALTDPVDSSLRPLKKGHRLRPKKFP
jgi:uncharacterized protein YciI